MSQLVVGEDAPERECAGCGSAAELRFDDRDVCCVCADRLAWALGCYERAWNSCCRDLRRRLVHPLREP